MDRNTTCTRCGTSVDLATPHVTRIEQTESEYAGVVTVHAVAPEPTYRHETCTDAPSTGVAIRDVTGLADRIRAAAAGPAFEGAHPSRGPLIAVAAVELLLDACPPCPPGGSVDGDLLRDAIADALPRLLTDEAARAIADTVLERVAAAGIAVLHGPDLVPRPTPGRSQTDGPCDTCDPLKAGPPCPGAPGWCPGRGTPPVAPGAIPAPREATS